MKYLNHYFAILALLLCSQNTLTAQFNLSGQVTGDGAPLPYAEVLLQDSLGNFLKGNFTDEAGNFSLLADGGHYQLAANYLGYRRGKWKLELTRDLNLGELKLSSSGTELETVTVTATRRLVEQRTDRLVFHVENSAAAAGGSGVDALQLAPGVRLQNGALELIGRGAPGLMINGRLIQLNGEELTRFLAGLNADNIASIEIIGNPPARYAAAGQGGLINIVLKKARADAWKNSTALTHTQAFYGFTNLNNNFSFNRDKLSLVVGGSLQRGNKREYEGIRTTFPASVWRTEMYNNFSMDNASGRLSLDYEFSDRFSLGAQYLGNFGKPSFSGTAETFVSGLDENLDSLLVNEQSADRSINSHSANLHGKWQLDTSGWLVNFDVDLFDYDNLQDQDNDILSFGPDNELLGINLAQNNRSDQLIDNLSGRIDVEQNLGQIKLGYGIGLTRTKTLGDQINFNTRSGSPIFDPALSNTFAYEETVESAYLNTQGSWGEKLSWQLGMRLENTRTEGFSVTLNQRTNNDYLRFFPTAYLNYHSSENIQFIFSYGRRINRPSFRNLNPFRVFANSNTFSEGNPFLQPSFTDRFELVHVHRGNLRTRLFFNRTIDGFGTLFSGETDSDIQAVIRRNYFTDYFYGLAESYGFELGRWSSQNQLYFYQGVTKVSEEFEASEQVGFQLNLSSSNTFRIGKGGKLQLNAWYNAPHRSNVFQSASTWSITFGWRQQLGEKLEVAIVANDVFDRSSLRSLESEINGVNTIYAQNYAARNLRFSISYRFGNDQLKVKQRGFGNDEIRGRSR